MTVFTFTIFILGGECGIATEHRIFNPFNKTTL